MPSHIWNQQPDEAFEDPYNYKEQESFVCEANEIIECLQEIINPRLLRYPANVKSLDLAVWMLRSDTIDSLRETLRLIGDKRHKPAGVLFREALETADTAFYFASEPTGSGSKLKQWFENESPSHGLIRKWIEEHEGREKAEKRKAFYHELCKFSHRTYRALLKGYSLGGGDRLVHDSWRKSNTLVLPHTIASFYCVLAELILIFLQQLRESGGIDEGEFLSLWNITGRA